MPLTFRLIRSTASNNYSLFYCREAQVRCTGCLSAMSQGTADASRALWLGWKQAMYMRRCGFCATSVQNSPHWESATLFKARRSQISNLGRVASMFTNTKTKQLLHYIILFFSLQFLLEKKVILKRLKNLTRLKLQEPQRDINRLILVQILSTCYSRGYIVHLKTFPNQLKRPEETITILNLQRATALMCYNWSSMSRMIKRLIPNKAMC